MSKPFIKEKSVHSFVGSAVFTLKDRIRYPLFSWPLTPVTYRVNFSTDSVRANELVLKVGSDQIPFQLSGTNFRGDGTLLYADVTFMADLPSGGERVYRLEKGTPRAFESGITATEDEDGITVTNSQLQVKLPRSCRSPLNVPGPVSALGDGGGWLGSSCFINGERNIDEINTECIENGAVFSQWRVEYRFEQNGVYTADIRLYGGLDFIELDETVTGIDACKDVYWRFDWNAFSATHRYAPNNPGQLEYMPGAAYEDYPWHKIDEPYVNSFTHPIDLPTVGKNRELPFRLNVFEVQNAVARNKNACFWDERTGKSVGIFLSRSENWDNGRYDIFTSWDGSAIKYFYENNSLRWRFPVANGTRSLGLTVYNHNKDKTCFGDVIEALKGFDGFPVPKLELYAVSYTNWLENWYNTLNLDKIKEYTLDYPENGRRPEKICAYSSFKTPEEMREHMFTYFLIPSLPFYGASVNGGYSGVPYRRLSAQYFNTWNLLWDKFSEPQREQVQAILLLLLYLAQGECCMPLFIMHGGPPNLLSDVKRSLGQTACLFPDHPDFKLFMGTFEKLIPLTSLFMTRTPLKQFMLRGGRWAESLGTYVWAYLHSTLYAHEVSRILGGCKNTACTEQTDMLGQWLIHSLTAPFAGENPESLALHSKNHRYWGTCFPLGENRRRMHLPQGAHAARRVPPNTMWHLALALERYAPLTAEHLRYVSRFDDIEAEEGGRSDLYTALSVRPKRDGGTRPEFRSCAFTGYGIILRSGVDTKDELSVHLQQIDGGPNYRWGTAGIGGNGAVYYYAAGKAYSHNGSEEIGDGMFHDCDAGCMFGVWKGFKYCSIGPNVMTNGYYDTGAFQYAKINAEVCPDSYAWPEYQSRSITLSHSDYILIYDEVGAPTVKTRFAWSAARYDELPDIQILTKTDNRCELFTPESKTVWYHGMGDSVALVTHREGLSAAYAKGCAVVQSGAGWTDYIFRSPKSAGISVDEIEFKGRSAAVRVNTDGTFSLALFDGSLLRVQDITVETHGSKQVAVSLYDRREFTFVGRVVSLFDTKVRINRENSNDTLYIDGEAAAPDGQGFVSVPKGEHKVNLTRKGHWPVPEKARILHVSTGSGQAEIHWQKVHSAERYDIELSRDGGETWQPAGTATGLLFTLSGLEKETKIHFRVTAVNFEHSGEPSHEYPALIGGELPLPPDGLALKMNSNNLSFTWGEVLGACEYTLYEKRPGGEFLQIYRGPQRAFVCSKAITGISEYAVAAVNLNGEGELSDKIDDNPESLANWHPVKDSFDRNSLYNHHPFYANNIHQYKPTPEQYPAEF